MPTVEVVRGGSGRWSLYYPDIRSGRLMATGHVPDRAPFDATCARQIERQVTGRCTDVFFRVKGGQHVQVTISEQTFAALDAWYNELEADAASNRAAEKAARVANTNAAFTCPVCGGDEDVILGVHPDGHRHICLECGATR